jgi:hypothetical protein
LPRLGRQENLVSIASKLVYPASSGNHAFIATSSGVPSANVGDLYSPHTDSSRHQGSKHDIHNPHPNRPAPRGGRRYHRVHYCPCHRIGRHILRRNPMLWPQRLGLPER